MSILSSLRSAKFSSDRTIHEYAQDIWNVKPIVTNKDGKYVMDKKPEEELNIVDGKKHVKFEKEQMRL